MRALSVLRRSVETITTCTTAWHDAGIFCACSLEDHSSAQMRILIELRCARATWYVTGFSCEYPPKDYDGARMRSGIPDLIEPRCVSRYRCLDSRLLRHRHKHVCDVCPLEGYSGTQMRFPH